MTALVIFSILLSGGALIISVIAALASRRAHMPVRRAAGFQPYAAPFGDVPNVERRLSDLERDSHAPYDFTHLIERLERLEPRGLP